MHNKEQQRKHLQKTGKTVDMKREILYDALAKQYVDSTTERAMKSLNILCVRMVFCLYAEDAGIFGQHGMFHDYLEEFDARKMRKAMIELFQILDTKPEDRDPYLKDDNPQLAAFPYVNGGLFANEDIEIPPFTDEIRNLLLEKASADFDWSEISPTSQLNDMIDIFSNTETYICPTCLQPVSEKYKQDLVQSVQKVLSKTVEEHLAELRTVMAEEIEIDFSPFSKLEMSTNSCLEILAQINMGIRNNNLLIQSKIDNPYSICNGEIISVSNLLTQLNKALENLENERLEYNKKITDTKPIIKRLTEINNLIAYLDIRELYIQYLACKAQLKKEHEKLEERRATCTNLTKLVDELEAKQKNVRVALSIINRNLSYIFFSNDRFKIDYRNNNYVLLSNGKPVQPSKISQGERNIIGLCYFFASILENQEETTAYTKEYLLLIDDPVSSFDMENKTGIMSFLRYQLGKFLLGNEYTKSIIMTHDLLTYYDSEKMFGELIEASKVKYGGDKPVYKRYELKNKILIPFPHNGRQEYTELMKIVYRFALGDADEYELVIGNIMRQVLEAFSTFQYKKGIEEVSTDRSILAILPEKEYQSYFENLMYRLILNNGSHRLDQTRSMSDMNFFTVISDSEKKRTAKEILCFIYLLNEKHVLAHLDGCSNVQSNLSKWCNDVKNKVGA